MSTTIPFNRCLAILGIALLSFSAIGQAQTAPLPTVAPGQLTQLTHCPAGFFNGTPTNQTVCYQHTYSCSQSNPIPLTFSYLSPISPKGTIVLFNGGGGEMTEQDNNMFTAEDYFFASYAVVQTSWAYDWEDTNGGTVPISPTPPFNILTAACRPASFLNYIYSNTQFHATNTAMCSQGASAGGAAIAYSIVWYGQGSKLNNVELAAGPTLSDIKIGCQYPRYGNVDICTGTQSLCSPQTLVEANSVNGTPLWVDDAEYIANYQSSVQTWTGNLQPQACNNGSVNTTTSNPIWKAQSIVTGTGGVFSWPTSLQGLGGWACFSYSGQCNSQNVCPDNAGAEAQQFYLQVNSQVTAPGAYVFTGIQGCIGAEGVGGGVDPDYPNLSGTQGIETHMETYCQAGAQQ